MTLFSAPALIEFARALWVRVGVPDANALLVADSLISSNLRGVDSHGFQMLLAYRDDLHGRPGIGVRWWLLDMATTTVALGKIHDASHRKEATIPAGWATDAARVPTTDTQAALRGRPTPLGGYKGSGLGLLVEFLTAG